MSVLKSGIAVIKNESTKTAYIIKSAVNQDPWEFVKNGQVGPQVAAKFFIEPSESVQLTCGPVSVDADDGPNFFIRFQDDDDAPFCDALVYCSGDPEEITEYFIVAKAGKPFLDNKNMNSE